MRAAILCLAAAAQLMLSSVSAEPITIPLYRRSVDGGITKAAGQALDNGVLAGKVQIGNPPEEFTMAFDTSTGFSWVRGSRCKTENCLDRCTYYARRSDSSVPTGKRFSVEYGDACVDTHVYLDTMRFAGLTVNDFPIGGAYRMSGFGKGFDGYLGLGRSVDFNQTKIHTTSSTGLSKRAELPDSSFVPAAYSSANGLQSAQFGIYTTTETSVGFDSGTDSPDDSSASSDGSSGTTSNSDSSNAGTQPGQPSQDGQTTQGGVSQPPGQPGQNGQSTQGGVPQPPGQGVPQPPGQTAAQPQPNNTATTNMTMPANAVVNSGGVGFMKRSNDEEQAAGYLVLGGVDQTAIDGEMTYIKLADEKDGGKNWDVCIKHAKIGHDLRLNQKSGAIASISTSTPYIVMPADQADCFHDKFGGKYYHSTRTYSVKCSEIPHLPPLKLTLEDYIVELPAKYWTRVIDKDRDCCATRISRGNSDRDWVLGTSFTNPFYTTFDPEGERIGLALKKGQCNDGLKIYKSQV